MRTIEYIIIHCTATPQDTTVEQILNYWKHHLGWKNPGYHYLIEPSGTLNYIHPIEKVANGVRGLNQESIHVSYIGGVKKNGEPTDNRTGAQRNTMRAIVSTLSAMFPDAEIKGHRDFANKACPSFDVAEQLNKILIL